MFYGYLMTSVRRKKLQDAVSAIVRWRVFSTPRDMFDVFSYADFQIAYVVSTHSLSAHLLAYWLTELRKISTCLPVYFSSVVILHVARRAAIIGFDDELMDILVAVVAESTPTIYCLENVYLAALYYTAGEYQTVIDHCTLVLRSQDHSQCRLHVARGEILPKLTTTLTLC